MVSSYRVQHGEGRVVMDSTLTRIAHEQAEAMAAKDKLDHDVLGGFTSPGPFGRGGPSRREHRLWLRQLPKVA
jgi:uncharacterized protein YkwD